MRRNNLRLTAEKVVIPEKVRERNGLYVLELLGYKTWRIGKPVPVTCRQCRAFQWAQASGNDKSFPDCVIGHTTRWQGFTLLLETKRTGGKREEGQVALVEEGVQHLRHDRGRLRAGCDGRRRADGIGREPQARELAGSEPQRLSNNRLS